MNLTTAIETALHRLASRVDQLPNYNDIALALAAAIQEHFTLRARRSATDTRMIGSPLDLVEGDAEHRALLEESRIVRAVIEPSTYRDGPRHVIVGERQEGKTYLAEQWLLNAPGGVERVLVTSSLAMAGEIRHRLGLKNSDSRVISFHSLTGPGRSARADVEYGFDETGRILEQLLRLKQPPHLLTITTAAEWQGRDA
ncbi:hypothetical protein [Microbacterium sp.]|jgi:hypothetical protein|uniref:hypothetical protein n=1 Tax=Microbacterium sp. TaxID=51671 RepID=UPI0037CC4467